MTISIEEAKAFIEDAKKARQNWLTMAERSWNEIKKRQKNHRLWSVTPNSIKKRARYPAWYSIFKIRQPLLLSRVGIPIGKDTTQDGADPVGSVAAILLERLATNLAKTFDFFDVMCCARDDFLATNFGLTRAYYERKEVKEKVKIEIFPQQLPTGEMAFVDGAGNVIMSDAIIQDGPNWFYESEEVVDVTDEKICLEPLLYRDVFVDPDIRRWNRCKRLGFLELYSEVQFKRIFGNEAFSQLPKTEDQQPGKDEASPKRQCIKVYEYWDEYEEEVLWFAEDGTDFIKPKAFLYPDQEDIVRRGLYDLEKFFPVPTPLLSNQATDEFWPIPEYYQLSEVFEDIHTIFSRMCALTRSIRSRLLFDNNIEGLQALINEASEGDAIGVTNLAQMLNSGGGTGSLESVVQYIPVAPMIEALNQCYIALEQRLNTVYKLTGTSDLLQGLITDQTDRTLGERQMLEKYALNQIAEPQGKMAEYVCNSYQLMAEMALKNFKDESLEKYIIPGTLEDDAQAVYPQGLQLLKNDPKRFRIELETDSTIALNEQYDKAMRVELVNALTTALEKTANIATTSPALVVPELHAMKFLIQGFRQGKLFQNEITQAIDNVIKAAQDIPAPFNKDEAQAQLKQSEMQQTAQLKQYELLSHERIEMFKIQQDATFKQLQNQIATFKAQAEAGAKNNQLQLEYERLNAELMKAQEQFDLDRNALIVRLREIADKKEVSELQALMDAQAQAHDAKMSEAEQSLEAARVSAEIEDNKLDLAERVMTERRLQESHQLEKASMVVDMATKMKPEPQAPQSPPKVKKQFKMKKDKSGNVQSVEVRDERG